MTALKKGMMPIIGLLIAGLYALCPALFQSPMSADFGACIVRIVDFQPAEVTEWAGHPE